MKECRREDGEILARKEGAAYSIQIYNSPETATDWATLKEFAAHHEKETRAAELVARAGKKPEDYIIEYPCETTERVAWISYEDGDICSRWFIDRNRFPDDADFYRWVGEAQAWCDRANGGESEQPTEPPRGMVERPPRLTLSGPNGASVTFGVDVTGSAYISFRNGSGYEWRVRQSRNAARHMDACLDWQEAQEEKDDE